MPVIVAVWWWLHPDYMAIAGVALAVVTSAVAIFLGLIALKISRRQTEMQTEQHAVFQKEAAKKTDLRVIVQGTQSQFSTNVELTTTVRFNVHNGGDKSADGFYWELLVPEDIALWVDFVDADGLELEKKYSHQSETEHYRKIDGHYTNKLWGFTGLEVARIRFKPSRPELSQFVVKWRIRGEDGMVPPEGLAFISLKMTSDGTFSWSRWHLGQKESDLHNGQGASK